MSKGQFLTLFLYPYVTPNIKPDVEERMAKNASMICDNVVFHYTSLDALFNIIRNGNLSFRASRHDCMNDPCEYLFGRTMLEKFIKEGKIDGSKYDSDSQDYIPYIVSFSPLKDAPVMWRLYRAGVSIEIKKEFLKKQFPEWLYGDCEYANEDNFLEVFDSVANHIETMCIDSQDYSEQYNNILTLIKHSDYMIEPEFRVYFRNSEEFTFDGHEFKDIDADFTNEYKAVGLNIKYYKELIIPAEALSGIIIHCFDNEEFENIKKHIIYALNYHGFDASQICIIRTNNVGVRY